MKERNPFILGGITSLTNFLFDTRKGFSTQRIFHPFLVSSYIQIIMIFSPVRQRLPFLLFRVYWNSFV